MAQIISFPRMNVQVLTELHHDLVNINLDYARFSREGNSAALLTNNLRFERWGKRLEAIMKHRLKNRKHFPLQ